MADEVKKEEIIHLGTKVKVYATKKHPHLSEVGGEGAEHEMHPKLADHLEKAGFISKTKPVESKK